MAASCPDNPAPNDESYRENSDSEIQDKPEPDDGSPPTSPTPKEPFMGNVNWYTPFPPDVPAQLTVKGMLTFDAAYENGICVSIATVLYVMLSLGNLGKVDYISEFEYDLYIRPDTCNPKSVSPHTLLISWYFSLCIHPFQIPSLVQL